MPAVVGTEHDLADLSLDSDAGTADSPHLGEGTSDSGSSWGDEWNSDPEVCCQLFLNRLSIMLDCCVIFPQLNALT